MKMSKKILPILVVLGLGGLYVIWLKLTGMAIPCFFRKVTGYLCPGCGVTGLLYHLVYFNIRESYRANPFLFVTGPLLIGEICYSTFQNLKGKKLPRWNEVAVLLYAAALCVFGILRNLQ